MTVRRPELDGLRGIAILLVIAQHYVVDVWKVPAGRGFHLAALPTKLAWTGVDLFFVLSGYLLGGILLANVESSTFFRTFYARRAYRILPLYLVLIAACYALSPTRPPLLRYLTFTQNFWMAAAGTLGAVSLAVTWSLALEEQFYLILPAIVRFTNPRKLWRVLVICLLIPPCLRAIAFFWIGQPAIFASHILLFTRLDTLMLGVLVAWLESAAIVIPDRAVYFVWLAAGIGMLCVAQVVQTRPVSWVFAVFSYDVIAFFYAATLIMTLRGKLPFLKHSLVAYIGVISYGLYLLHQPVRMLFHSTIAAVVTFGLAALSWELFEKPLVARGHRHIYARDSV